MRKTIIAAVVAGVVAGVAYLAFSYVTAFGDETRLGVRVARKLGVRPTNYPVADEAEIASTVAETLISKAIEAGIVESDEDFVQDLRDCEGPEEVLGAFFTYVLENEKGDPEELLRNWGIIQ